MINFSPWPRSRRQPIRTPTACCHKSLVLSSRCRKFTAAQSATEMPIQDPDRTEYAVISKHRMTCILPSNIAYLLEINPQLIAVAIESFYYRDLESMKVKFNSIN